MGKRIYRGELDKKNCVICGICFYRKGRAIKEWDEQAKFCSYKCQGMSKKGISPMQGKKHTEASKLKSSISHRGKVRLKSRGENHYNWKGGISKEADRIRHSVEYRNWRTAIFERDDYTCQECGIRNKLGLGKTIILQADHIKPFADYPELRFEMSNGRTLCLNCHKLTDSYGWKLRNKNNTYAKKKN